MLNKRRLWILVAVVSTAHICLIAWLEWETAPPHYTPPKERLIVATVKLAPEKKVKKIAENPSVQPVKKVHQKTKPAPKKIASQKPKSAPEKKVSEQSKPSVTKKKDKPLQQKTDSKQEELKGNLIAQARERLNRLGKSSKSIDQAKGVESLKIDSIEGGAEDQGYYSQLAACLRQNLRLPEFGEVRVHLTIDCMGKAIRVKIVNSQNENNRRYVEKVLPKVGFPPFDKAFKNEKEHTFSITLANDL